MPARPAVPSAGGRGGTAAWPAGAWGQRRRQVSRQDTGITAGNWDRANRLPRCSRQGGALRAAGTHLSPDWAPEKPRRYRDPRGAGGALTLPGPASAAPRASPARAEFKLRYCPSRKAPTPLLPRVPPPFRPPANSGAASSSSPPIRAPFIAGWEEAVGARAHPPWNWSLARSRRVLLLLLLPRPFSPRFVGASPGRAVAAAAGGDARVPGGSVGADQGEAEERADR